MNCDPENKSVLKDCVIKKLNEELGKEIVDLSVLNDTKKRLEDEKEKIQKSLLLNASDFPSTISTATKHVEEVLEKIKKLTTQHDNLTKSVDKYQEKVNRVKVKAESYINKIDDLEKTFDYLKIIKEVEDISNSIEAAINDKNEKKQIMNYLTLCHICNTLTDSKCVHLYTFVNETMHYWHNILKERFTADYDEILKAIKWPFVGNSVLTVPSTETMNRFQILTENLLQIQLDTKALMNSSLLTDFPPLSLPMMQLIKPLRKRFVYHFMGSRQTNRADKPEWFFTQVLTWIKDHQDFVEKNIQPLYDKFGRKNVVAKIELMRGLVQIVVEKLHFELPHLHYDDSLFSHCIDEALGFDKELKTGFGYPSTEPGVIEVLTQAQIFVKWINMEKRYTLEKMDRILGSATAFDTLVSGDVDENHVTECADGFLTLLSTITERYEMLSQPGHKLQFLQLQLDLIDDFRVRLLQMLQEENVEPLTSKFPNILNTVNYVRNVLEEWSVNTLFLHLQYYKSKLEGKPEPTGTVFDEYLGLLSKMRDDLIEELVDHVFMEFKAKSMPYRRDKWHAMESPKNLVKPVITPSACPMFQVLITRLHQLQELLAGSLFKQCWSTLARKLDEYLYEEMVAICVFNEGGALQFNYDITRNLFPLFGQYYNKPEVHFKYLKDSCVLLAMPQGLVLSLQEAITKQMDNQYDVSEILADVGVFTLGRDAVLELFSRRTDLN